MHPHPVIESFRLVRVNKRLIASDDADLEVTQFPTLTPAELLAKNPSYSDLLKKYKRTFPLKVNLQNGSGSLAIVGTEYNDPKYRVVSAVRDLEPNSTVRCDPRGEGARGCGGRSSR